MINTNEMCIKFLPIIEENSSFLFEILTTGVHIFPGFRTYLCVTVI